MKERHRLRYFLSRKRNKTYAIFLFLFYINILFCLYIKLDTKEYIHSLGMSRKGKTIASGHPIPFNDQYLEKGIKQGSRS